MSPEQFTTWLRGFLDREGALTATDLKKVQDKLATVVAAPAPMQFVPIWPAPALPWPNGPTWGGGVEITFGSVKPNLLYPID